MQRRLLWTTVLVTLAASALPPLSPAQTPTRRALLVGCGKYEYLPITYTLHGPPNDVALFEQTLTSRLGVAVENIRVLTDDRGEENQPRRDTIMRAMQQLIERTHNGDQVLLLLAGHGSRQPDDDGDERDGWDEVFLPSDVRKWERGPVAIPGAITDDEINDWLLALEAKGAFVFLIADSCHSGTLSRAVGDRQTREVAVGDLLPKDAMVDKPTAERPADNTEGGFTPANVEGLKNLVSLYAVSQLEKEEERDFEGTSYGLLSYAVCSVLAQTAEPLTYRELAQQARWYLQGMPQPWYKGPVLEGTAIDREVLGAQEKLGRSSISLERINAGQLRVDVGYLHGLTIGSVLSVYPPTGSDNSQELSGYVRVTAVQPWEATVVPYAYGDKEARSPEELPTPGNCRVEYIDYGALRLRVAVAGLSNDSKLLNLADRALHGEQQAALVKVVEGMASAENSLVELVDTPEQAHWWLLVDERGVYLRQAGDEADEAARKDHLFGPYALDGTEELEEALLRVAKVVNLRQLAAASDTVVTRSAAAEVVASIGQRNLTTGEITPVSKFAPLRWRNGDQAVVTLTNRGRLPVDVTVLYIDSAFGIAPFLPLYAGHDNRLYPGADAKPLDVRFDINDSTLGFEDVIVITQVIDPTRQNGFVSFAGIAQPQLTRTRGEGDTPLQRLMDHAAFGETRGAGAPPLASYSIQRLKWEVIR